MSVLMRDAFNRAGSNDVNHLSPGDIILFEAEKPASLVSRFQRSAGYTSAAANIVHASVYISNGVMCHAVPKAWMKLKGGIVLQRVWDYASDGSRKMYVLRDNSAAIEKRMEVALYAASKSIPDSSYSWEGIIDLISHFAAGEAKRGAKEGKFFYRQVDKAIAAMERRRSIYLKAKSIEVIDDDVKSAQDSLGIKDAFGGVGSFICSDLVTHCYDTILGRESPFAGVRNLRMPLHTPADIFLNSKLFSVSSGSESDAVVLYHEKMKNQAITPRP